MSDFPASSRLTPELVKAYYYDSYEAPLRKPGLKIHELYVAILGHLPWWARVMIIARNSLVSLFGLHTETAATVWKPELKDIYTPGDKIVRFKLYSQDENEIIAGLDDKHLDFRVSVLRFIEQGEAKVAVSTIIFVHSLFGKIYLLIILPFHKFGLKRLLSNAIAHHRI
jgi:hypothetical protein